MLWSHPGQALSTRIINVVAHCVWDGPACCWLRPGRALVYVNLSIRRNILESGADQAIFGRALDRL